MLIQNFRENLSQKIYLDYNASTPVLDEVLLEMIPYFKECFYNITNPYAIEIQNHINKKREDILKSFGGTQGEIVFYSGATEALNAVIQGVALKSIKNGEVGKNIIVSAIEHDAVIVCAKSLEKLGVELLICPVDENGVVILEELKKIINKDTLLVSIMHVNNETGVIQPLENISKICREKEVLLHSDGVIAVGRVDISNIANLVDFYTISANKFYGPKGISLNYIRDCKTLIRIICGSNQENHMRAGTQNTPNIIGLAKAFSLTMGDYKEVNKKEKRLITKLKNWILENIPNIKVNGNGKIIDNTLNVSFKKLDRNLVLSSLINQGVFANVGATYLDAKCSHVIKAMCKDEDYVSGSVRFSVGRNSTELDIYKTITALEKTILPLCSG